ncbi:MAG TPA: YlbF family regulator [Candidatus Onthousia faecavium]|nr:YlbF family regulator [Candidatus Onthousia faecavium]
MVMLSNEEIIKKAYDLVNIIKNSDTYKDYIKIRALVAKDSLLLNEINKVKALQKDYVKSAYLDKTIEEELNEILERLQENTLYQDYIAKERALNNILIMIKEGLNTTIDELINTD